jgi:rare lipoprotein A
MKILHSQSKIFFILLIFLQIIFLNGCTTTSKRHHRYPSGADHAPNFNIDINSIPNAVPKVEPLGKRCNRPYTVNGHTYTVLKSSKGYHQTGIASWYGMKFDKQRTSNGEVYDVAGMTAASKVLPWPFHENRVIDLSYVGAAKLGMLPTGTALVDVKAIDPSNSEETTVSQTSSALPAACAPATSDSGIPRNPQIYMQIGAFRVESNANNLQKKIKQYTQYPVIIKHIEKNNAALYRVQIGPIPTVDSTDNLHDIIEKSGLGEPVTVIQ